MEATETVGKAEIDMQHRRRELRIKETTVEMLARLATPKLLPADLAAAMTMMYKQWNRT
jgi:hypothetical protein